MNRQPDSFARVPVPVMFALVALFCIAPVALSTGCLTGRGQLTPSTGVYDTNLVGSTLVVTVENTRQIALDAFDSLMRLERQHRVVLEKANPKIHVVAENVRKNGRAYLNALTSAKVAYQNDRSTANATALTNALATVQSLLKDAIGMLSEIAAKKP